MSNNWEMVIGLEVHAQLKTSSKLFSSSPNQFGSEPNENVNFIDSGMPGMLPVMNFGCIEMAIKTGYALNFKINKHSVFERKNYFYPDLPQGYQISQFEFPILSEGYINIESGDNQKKIRIERAHLEQDAGKSIHDIDPKYSFIDLNRVGTPLLEIVSYPDLSSADEVINYMSSLRQLLMYIDVCDGNMQEGSLRADVNVSVRKEGEKNFGTRCEIKNVNSIKFMEMAIESEAKRQVELIESGKKIEQETRLFDTKKNETRSMRSKEEAHDYRYFPDPDLLPLEIEQSYVDDLKNKLPELPDKKKERFINKFKLTPYEANVLISENNISEYFEEVIKTADIKLAKNWIIVELFAVLNDKNLDIKDSPVSSKNLANLINLISSGEISGKIAKKVFELMVQSGDEPSKIIKDKGLQQQSDPKELEKIIKNVLKKNLDKITQYKAGKEKLYGFFVGEVMKASSGKANPKLVNDILKKELKK